MYCAELNNLFEACLDWPKPQINVILCQQLVITCPQVILVMTYFMIVDIFCMWYLDSIFGFSIAHKEHTLVSFLTEYRRGQHGRFWITTRASDSDFVLVILRTPSTNQNFVWRKTWTFMSYSIRINPKKLLKCLSCWNVWGYGWLHYTCFISWLINNCPIY